MMEEQWDRLKRIEFGRKFLGHLNVGSKEEDASKDMFVIMVTLNCPQNAHRDVLPYPAQMCHTHKS